MTHIDYTVSVVPVNTIPAVANDYAAHDVIDAQVGRSLAAQVTLTSAGSMITLASLTGSTYAPATRYSQVTPVLKAFTALISPALLYIRHTGKLYSTPSVLGATATDPVEVRVLSSTVCILLPGQVLVLPCHNDHVSDASDIQLVTDSQNVAVEAVVLK
jgi:hypothetical protein